MIVDKTGLPLDSTARMALVWVAIAQATKKIEFLPTEGGWFHTLIIVPKS